MRPRSCGVRRFAARRRTSVFVVALAGAALGIGLTAPAGAVVAPPSTPPSAPSAPVTAPDALPDPLQLGPSAVSTTEYNDGNSAFQPPDFPGSVEVRASVHYPTLLNGGPYPLVMLMHGRHATCYADDVERGGWPCKAGYESIPSFQGYDYLADNLASWGYIVVSVSANGINAKDSQSPDFGMTARGELMQHHLDKWQEFSTTGAAPFGRLFVGKVDLQNVGEMGHSRGGEGVVRNVQINRDAGSPYGIQALLPLAPVDFGREVLNDIPMSVVLPYCDGDVFDLQGIHYYDDARYAVARDDGPKYTQELLASNHNYFNTVWTPGLFPAGANNDSTCPRAQLTPAQQRNAGEAYMAAFFRLHLGGESAFTPYFDGTEADPASIAPAKVHTAYHAGASDRRDINRYLAEPALEENQLGGKVVHRRVVPFDLCGGAPPQPADCLPLFIGQQPHTEGDRPGLSQLRYGWSDGTGRVRNEIPPASSDVSGFDALTFRVGRAFTDELDPEGQRPNFKVRVADGRGEHRSVRVGRWSDALFDQPGRTRVLPKLVLNTVRIPLSAFDGVDLTDVRAVTFRHNVSQTGAILSTDLAFTDRAG